MGKKKIVLEFVFEEVVEDDEYTYLKPVSVSRKKSTTLTEGEISTLGENIGQSDRWQVENWISIQEVLGNSRTKSRPLR